jgi:hypothetical protein
MFHALALAVVLSTAPSGAPRKALPKTDPLHKLVEIPGMEFYKKVLIEEEPKQLWKQIHWVSIDDVRALARENRKPILLAIFTGHGGQAKAGFT